MMKLPKFFDVDGTLVKFELDPKTGEVVSTTASGAPFHFDKVLEGTEITEKEYNMLRIFPLTKAIEIAKLAHKGQLDKANKPYIDHPLNVMNQLNGNMAKMTGVLHDVVEDTSITFEDLAKMGCPKDVIEALKLVTHPKDYRKTKEEYFKGIRAIADSGNQLAIDVKYADLTHNSDLSRLSNQTEKDIARIAKYKTSMEILKPLVSDYLIKHD
jgi:(p)ppGpp synthase/HD superfamily hydrolase